MYPGLTHGAYAALHAHGTDEQKATYLHKMTSGEWTGTMCLTEPHCGTDLGLMRTKAEPSPTAPTASPATRSSSAPASTTWPTTSSTWCWPACPTRPPASRASACSSCPSSWSMQGRQPGRAQRHLLRRPGAQDGHPRQRHLPDRAGRRGRHHGGPAQQGHAGHVRDDECRPPGRGQPVAGPDRSGLPERAGLCQGPHPDAQPVRPQGQGQAGRPDHRAPGRAQDAADRQGLCRRRPCAGHLLLGAAGQGAQPPRRKGAQGQRRNAVAAHAHRQGLPHRQRHIRPPTPACRCLAAMASSRNGAWSSLCATTAST
jgi:hypothetical protein